MSSHRTPKAGATLDVAGSSTLEKLLSRAPLTMIRMPGLICVVASASLLAELRFRLSVRLSLIENVGVMVKARPSWASAGPVAAVNPTAKTISFGEWRVRRSQCSAP